jgi:cytoskeleton protein RodZ
MKITGQILKENRERKNISINEVAIATKINMKTLQALEAGDVDNLPPKTFLRGFVRAYASYLGLDIETVMTTFQEEMGSTRPQVTAEVEAPVPRVKPSAQAADEAINPRASLFATGGWISGIVLVAVLIFFVKQKMDSYEREAVVEILPAGISSLPPDLSTPIPTPTAQPTPESSTMGGGAVLAPTTTPTPSLTLTPSPSPSASPGLTPTPTATPAPTATPRPKPSPSPTASPTPRQSNRSQDVIIEALDNVDVEVSIDNEPAKTIKLKGDQVQSIKARKKIVLKLSDGGAINLIVNGTERGVPGDLGKPLRIELP